MDDRAPIEPLLNIIELIDRIERQTTGLTREQFLEDHDIQDATAYRILAIGEAARDLSEELKARHADIPWRQILGMRNILAHEYFTRESEIIWETIKTGLLELAAVCRLELAPRVAARTAVTRTASRRGPVEVSSSRNIGFREPGR